MFNSTILDVAVGVVFAFLAVSLFTSAAVEAFNSLLKTRSKTLKNGIMALVNDPDFSGLAKDLYEHAAVSPLAADPTKTLPSYVDAMQFASAFLDVTGLTSANPGGAPGPQAMTALKGAIDKLPLSSVNAGQLEKLLNGIIDRSAGDIGKIQMDVASWFDAGMDRVSGQFKRWTQLMTFVVALSMSVAFNVDAVRLATTLWEQPSLADLLRQEKPEMPSADAGVPKTREDAAKALTAMMLTGLPVGWAPGHFFQMKDGVDWPYLYDSKQILWSIAGWFVTAVAALFGAPFWFDILQSVVRLRGTGPNSKSMTKRPNT